jgi:hypothetical protein
MRGVPVQWAPSGAAGMLIFQVSFSGTNMENAMDLPSGDQRASATFSVAWVTCVAGPSVSIQRTKICGPRGSPSAIYRMRFPSADQRGFEPLVRNRCWLPSAFMIQSEESQRSSILLACWRV